MTLGDDAWGGKLIDFTVAPALTSSPSVSHLAGMIALLWSANPDLSREQIIQILKESSEFYGVGLKRHPIYGWGRPDMRMALEKVLLTKQLTQ